MSANGSNARLDRIERLIEETELANKKAHEENRKAHEENRKAHEENRKAHEENRKAHERMDAEMRQSELANKKHRDFMDADIRRTRLDLRRWAALGVKEARRHRKKMLEIDEKITLLASSQLVTEEMLRQLISTMRRGQNGAKH